MKLEFRQTVTCNHLTLARACKTIDWQQPLPRCGEYVTGLDTLDGEQELPVRKLLHRTQDGSCLARRDGDVSALTKALNAALNGRGGGKPGICQGSCAATPEQVEAFLREQK